MQEPAPVKLAGLLPPRSMEPPLQTSTSDAAAIKASTPAGGKDCGAQKSSSAAVIDNAAPYGSSLRPAATTAAAAGAADAAQNAGDAARVPTSRTPNGYTPAGLPDTFRRAGPVLTEAEAAEKVRLWQMLSGAPLVLISWLCISF